MHGPDRQPTERGQPDGQTEEADGHRGAGTGAAVGWATGRAGHVGTVRGGTACHGFDGRARVVKPSVAPGSDSPSIISRQT